jgi:RNA polymerase sigma-70 factor (ECF subfamily)
MHHQSQFGNKTDMSDEHLLELALGGDGSCFGELVRRWEQRIYGFIRRYVGNSEEARDLTQDTFTKAYQNLDRLSDPARFSSWLYKIALNECRMLFRRQKGTFKVSLDEGGRDLARVDRNEAVQEQGLELKESVVQLRRAFTKLPKEQREVILMKEFQGLKFNEIAEILDVPLSTAKSRMYLGLKTLKRIMEEEL